jgi:AAA+ superfamily predicted ATPase
MQGINTTIEGKMTGVHHLYVEDGGFVSIAATSQTALLDNGTYIFVSDEGNFSLPTINIKQLGIIEYQIHSVLSD